MAPVDPRRQQEAALVGLEGQTVSGGNPGAIFRNELRATSGEIASTGAENLTETGLTIAEAEAAGAVLGLGLRARFIFSPRDVAVERAIADRWARGTFDNVVDSIEYHYGKHGAGRTLQQYTDDAASFFEQYKS